MLSYRREIDGLRAIAVLPVLLFHAGLPAFAGGYVGVDVFFVISGYLIGGILLAEFDAGRFSLLRFYERRARRILPALFAVMAFTVPAALWLLLPADLSDYGDSLIAVSAFASNLLFWQASGYFDSAAELRPLLHTWSLAVEEQFYLFFPLLLLLGRRLPGRGLALLLLATSALSLLLAEWASRHAATAGFYLLPTRYWELALGTLVALSLREREPIPAGSPPSLWPALGAGSGLALIGVAVFGFDADTRFPGLHALLPTLGTALILVCARPSEPIGRLLGSRVPVRIGLISYSAYLWHQPLFAFARHGLGEAPPVALMLALIVASLVLAALSWRWIEAPFRDPARVGRAAVFRFAAAGSLAFVALGLAGRISDGLPQRYSPAAQAVLAYADYPFERLTRSRQCFLQPEQDATAFAPDCAAAAGPEALMIWGDSHAAALAIGLRAAVPALIQLDASGCPPVLDVAFPFRPQCEAINRHSFEVLRRQQPGRIVLHADWALYEDEQPLAHLAATLARIRAAAPAARIVVVGPVPQWQPSLPAFLVRRGLTPATPAAAMQPIATPEHARLAAADAQVRAVAEAAGGVSVSALARFCTPAGRCQPGVAFAEGWQPLVWDHGHLTEAASRSLAEAVLAAFEPPPGR